MNLLKVENLSVAFPSTKGEQEVLCDVSFKMNAGEVLGLVGESGSGKSMTARAIAKLLAPNAIISSGSILFEETDLLDLPESEMRKRFRGKKISIIFQDSAGSFNPVVSVGSQLEEMFHLHTDLSHDEIEKEIQLILEQVHIPDAAEKYSNIAAALSGGQAQRFNIAMMALITKPDLLIVDEATTALDVTIQAQVLDLLFQIAKENNIAVLFITHDFGLVAEYTDNVVVLQNGSVIERGSVEEIFSNPESEYVRNLLRDLPRVDHSLRNDSASAPSSQVVGIEDLHVQFPIFGKKNTLLRGRVGEIKAVDGVSLSLHAGEILGIVGESGCGKTTLMRALLNVLPPEAEMDGSVTLLGKQLDGASRETEKLLRQKVGAVAQDPRRSLNPKMRVKDLIIEGVEIHNLFESSSVSGRVEESVERVTALMQAVGLDESLMMDFPDRLSGGELQRVAIARALATNPQILILDEPTASLDASRKKTILELLLKLQQERELSYIMITHELPTVASICDRVAVMYLGKVVEYGLTQDVFSNPQHPYTRLLMNSIPIPDPALAKERERMTTADEVPSAAHIPSGCRFRTRCPFATDECAHTEPDLQRREHGQLVACHYIIDDLQKPS